MDFKLKKKIRKLFFNEKLNSIYINYYIVSVVGFK